MVMAVWWAKNSLETLRWDWLSRAMLVLAEAFLVMWPCRRAGSSLVTGIETEQALHGC